jgi:hypothetical protein
MSRATWTQRRLRRASRISCNTGDKTSNDTAALIEWEYSVLKRLPVELDSLTVTGSLSANLSCYNPRMTSELSEKGYVLVKGLIEPHFARFMYKALLLMHWRGQSFRDNHIPTASSVTNEALTDALLLELRPRMEAISARRLVPAYSYARLYFHGDTMLRHRDRGSCEVSASIHLDKDGGDSSLWFAPKSKIHMDSGDGAVYLGCDAEHWRERFTGNTMGQIFLHYVAEGGPFSQHYFDGNPDRFPPSISDVSRLHRGEPLSALPSTSVESS